LILFDDEVTMVDMIELDCLSGTFRKWWNEWIRFKCLIWYDCDNIMEYKTRLKKHYKEIEKNNRTVNSWLIRNNMLIKVTF